MSPRKRRFSNLIVFSIVLVLVVIVSSGVYFFKIQKNEDYQNQLHFRELNTVAHSVRSSIDQFSRLGKTITNLLDRHTANASTAQDEKELADRSNVTNVLNRARNTPALAQLKTIIDDKTLAQNGFKDSAPEHAGVFTTSDYRTVYIGPYTNNTDHPLTRHAIEVYTADLLPNEVLSFPIVILAGGKGQLVAKKVYLNNSTYAADLEFQSVEKLLNELYDQQTGADGAEKLPSYSGTLDKEIAGISYRIFVQPITLSLRDENTVTFYLLGMVPLADIQIAKLAVSPSTGLWVFISLLVLSALVPILKIRFMSVRSHFTKTDISLFFTGCVLLLGMLTITVNHQLFYSHLVDTKKDQAQAHLSNIIEEFKNEVKAVTHIKTRALTDTPLTIKAAVDTVLNGLSSSSTPMMRVAANPLRSTKKREIWSVNLTGFDLTYQHEHYLGQQNLGDIFAESTFKLNYQGLISLFEGDFLSYKTRLPILRISESSYNFTDFALGHREYFQMAVTCQLWFASENHQKNCRDGLYIQRIKNVSDARLSTQFSFADFDNLNVNSTPYSEREVVSVSVKLNTFFERIMPKGFGYAVFDDQGEVLYHSDESRALLENILVETNNDEHIRSLISNNNHRHNDDSLSFNTTYRNAEHLFVASALSEQVPWHIVVFVNVDDISEYNLWMLLVAVVLFVQLMLVLLLWNRYVGNQLVWSHILSFRALKSEKQRQREGRSLYHHINFGATATLVFCAAIALLLLMSTVVDLSMRLALWSLFASALLLSFCAKLDALPSRALLWSHPVTSFFILFLGSAIASYFTFTDYSLNGDPTSLKTSVAGLVILLIGILVFTFAHSRIAGRLWLATPLSKLLKHVATLPLFQAAAQDTRYDKTFVIYMASLLWFFAVVPASMLVNSSNHYLLGFQAHQESEHIRQRVDEYQQSRLKYLQLIRPELDHTVEVNAGEILPSLLIPSVINDPAARGKEDQLKQFSCSKYVTENSIRSAFAQGSTSFVEICTSPMPDEDEHAKETVMHVDSFINSLMSQQAFGASLNQELFQFAQLEHKASMLIYDGNKFLREAVQQRPFLVAFSMLLTLIITYKFTRTVIVQRVMGEHISDNFMLSMSDQSSDWKARLKELTQSEARFKTVIIRTDKTNAAERISKATNLPVFKGLAIDITKALVQQNGKFLLVNRLKALKANDVGYAEHNIQKWVLVLAGLDDLAFRSTERKQAQLLMQELHALEHVNIVLLCDVSPLYRLCHQDDYPDVAEREFADVNEVLIWSSLLVDYTKLYDWTPPIKSRLDVNATALDALKFESKGWQRLNKIEALFHSIYGQQLSHIDKHWTHDQIIDFFSSHAGAIYRQKWAQCSLDERILLYQLAMGATVNPNSKVTLEKLLRRGYIYRDCGWFIVNESFRRFVLNAESEERFAQWLSQVSESSWQYVRIPVIVAVMVLAVMIVVSTGQSLQSVIAAITASLGLIPSVMRNLSFFKGTPSPSSE